MQGIRASEKAIQLILRYETWHKKAYDDGYGLMTIGVGHTKTKYQKGKTISDEKVWELFMSDLKDTEETLTETVKVELTVNEWDALVAFVFNIGGKQWKTSTLLKRLNEGEKELAVKQFARWRLVKGVVSNGLVRRRTDEALMFSGVDIFA